MEEGESLRSPFDELIGTEWVSDDPDDARVRVAFREDLCQPAGLVHGGLFSSLVESVCSRATFLAVADQGMTAMGQSHSISFVRAISEGSIEVRARARHRGQTTWVWDAEVSDSEGRLCAIATFNVAVRPMRRG